MKCALLVAHIILWSQVVEKQWSGPPWGDIHEGSWIGAIYSLIFPESTTSHQLILTSDPKQFGGQLLRLRYG